MSIDFRLGVRTACIPLLISALFFPISALVAPDAAAAQTGASADKRHPRPAAQHAIRSVRDIQRFIAFLKTRARNAEVAAEAKRRKAGGRREEHEADVDRDSKRRAQRDRADEIKNPGGREVASGREEAEEHGRAKPLRSASGSHVGEERERERERAGTDFLDAYLYLYRQRAFPHQTIDVRAYRNAIAHRDKMRRGTLFGGAKVGTGEAKPALVAQSWSYLGPTNLPVPYNVYYGTQDIIGRINCAAFNPSAPGTYYIAAATGGIWKTTDSGTNWTPLSDAWQSLQTSCIVMDPTNPLILYVGTGDFDALGYLGFGIMKSYDGGESWTNLGNSQFGTCDVSAILVDPENPQIITVATGRGDAYYGYVWRSTNGGTSWTQAFTTEAVWSGLAVGAKSSSGQRYYYAIGAASTPMLYRSPDRGVTWTAITTPISGNSYAEQLLRVAASPTAPNTVYIVDPYYRTAYSSANAGSSWTSIISGFPSGNSDIGATYNWSQYWYDCVLACSTYTDTGSNVHDVLYLDLIDTAQSLTGGTTWQSIGGPTYTDSSLVHNDQHAVAFNPNNPNDVLIGCDGGIYELTVNPTANTWSYNSLNQNLGVTQFYKADYASTNPTIMVGGTQDNASPAAQGNLLDWTDIGGGDGGFSAVDQNNDNNEYTTSEYLEAIYTTTDDWLDENYTYPPFGSGDNPAFIAPIALDPTNSNLLYAASQYLYQYNISADSWSGALGSTALGSDYVQYVAIAPTDGNRIYAGSVNGTVWMSKTQGSSWTQINTGSPALPLAAVNYVVVSPTNENTIYVGLGGTSTGHLYECANTAAATPAWTELDGTGADALPNVSLNAIALDIDNPVNTIYVGTDVGVFYTTTGGGTWYNATQPLGLPNVQVMDLRAVAGTRYLNAATYGRGIWHIPLQAQNPQSIDGTVTLQSCSNPAQPITFILRPTNGNAAFARTVTLTASGGFTLPNVPGQSYTLAIKGVKWLQRDVNVNATSGATGVTATLLAGDVNNDNMINIEDFGLLAAAYGSAPGNTNWNPNADLNCDGVVDINDFELLAANYGLSGDP
jgi:photosystem II stability/assembly factor-like uncharacterized protein